MTTEKDLRKRVKRIFGAQVHWVEPAFGSTVGLPDAAIRVGEKEFPVELKFWHVTKFGIKSVMRPAQIRYHVMSARAGVRTAILFGVDVQGSKKDFYMYLIANINCPKENYCISAGVEAHFVGMAYDDERSVRQRVCKLLTSESFWHE